MPPALDRLLASPSALRLLRSLVNRPELPTLNLPSCSCCYNTISRRDYTTAGKSYTNAAWRRLKKAPEDAVSKEQLHHFIEANRGAAVKVDDSSELDPLDGAYTDSSSARWARYLARCERYSGLRGIKEDWTSRRSLQHTLPIEDTPDAKFIWTTYIKHTEIVPQVINHAADLLRDNGQTYKHLYEVVMRYWLPRDAAHASEYHQLMLGKLGLATLPLKAIAHSGRSALTPTAYVALLSIYRNSDEHDIYDEVVPLLIEKGNIDMARQWHNLCQSRNDLPSEEVASHPAIQALMVETSMFTSDLNSSHKSVREAHMYNRDLKRRLAGRDTASVRFDDSFCARMFATRTFPPESIIQGLAMMGVNEIGPQALRAMASRTKQIEDLPKRFEELRAHGITLQGCVFSLALEKFALEHRWQLVRSMLDTDQHPDVFGDVNVQRKLLHFYLETGDQQQLQRTLAILTLFHNDSTQETWNLLLQTHVRRSGHKHVTEVLQDMQTRGILITQKSILVLRDLLRHRQIGHKPVVTTHAEFDDLRFVARVYMDILESGLGHVPPLAWREIIRRYGMTGRMKELRRLLLWLLCWYAPRNNPRFSSLPSSPFLKPATEHLRSIESERYDYFQSLIRREKHSPHPVRELFPPSLQQALIIWGFKAGLLPNAPIEQSLFGPILVKKHYRHRLSQRQILQRAHWSIGLEILVSLRDVGVYIDRETVVRALQSQFVVMFGRGQSSKKENRIMEAVNTIPYATYIREVNRIWGTTLFNERETSTKGTAQHDLWDPRKRRTRNRKSSLLYNEISGLDWQTSGSKDETVAGELRRNNTQDALVEMQHIFAEQSKALGPSFGFVADSAGEYRTSSSTLRQKDD